MTPPAPDRGHCKRARVMIGPDIDKSGVAPDIANAIRIGPRHLGGGKIMSAHLPRRFRRKPRVTGVIAIAAGFFLLGIHRDPGTDVLPISFHGTIGVAELSVTAAMLLPLLRIP